MKKCNRCGKVKELTEFYKGKGYPDGHRAICKKCFIDYQKKYYIEHKEKISKRLKKYYKENRFYILSRQHEYLKRIKLV